jgi:hypothetical protein
MGIAWNFLAAMIGGAIAGLAGFWFGFREGRRYEQRVAETVKAVTRY